MSGGLLRRRALSHIAALPGSATMKAQVSAVVRRCNAEFLQFVFEAALDAGHAEANACRRGVAVLFEYAAVQLSDDMSDGDCDYLLRPHVDGPVVLMALQNLFFAGLVDARVGSRAMARSNTFLWRVGAGQFDELHVSQWTVERSLNAAIELNGAQQAAYLEVLWAGTRLAPLSVDVGFDLGLLVHVATDIATRDTRLWSLSSKGRGRLMAKAREAARRLAGRRLACIDPVIAGTRPVLAGAR